MKVYDTANILAQEIKQSNERKRYKELKEQIQANPEKNKKVEEFEQLRYEMQLKQMQGINITQEEQNNLQEKYAELYQDEEIKQYFEAEVQFNVLIADVNKIIAEAVKDVL